jgi:heme-degrading monooxygenase HmoA
VIAILWRYQVAGGREPEFEEIYGAEGQWAQLFRRDSNYLGTELLRGEEGAYLTVDRWRDRASFSRFKADFAEDYSELDARCDALTLDEQPIGIFEGVAEC